MTSHVKTHVPRPRDPATRKPPTFWPDGRQAGCARVLAARAEERLRGSILPYDDRQRLLHLARILGIARFDASLIIAAVQNRAGALSAREVVVSRVAEIETAAARSWFRGTLGVVLLVQGLIVGAGWWLLGT